jgi:predicted CopG family antitoxin|tara:strand:- start:822 stop:1085 length:264 start_codon:yes stop_codon:yes gene_type:complete
MATITLTLEEYEALKDMAIGMPSVVEIIPEVRAARKPKRKVSKYSREFGRQLKALKAKHPRTKITQLMEKAHSKTRMELGMPRKSRK